MDDRTRIIIIGAVVLLILAAIFGTVFYLGQSAKNQNIPSDSTGFGGLNITRAPLSITPVPSGSTGGSQFPGTKTYAGQGFVLHYPSSWGVLICSNSQNLEFDPVSGTDLKGAVCDVAVKPITALVVSKLNCSGDTVKLGSYNVLRSKNTSPNGDVDYRWCYSVGGKNLDITHRVSAGGSRATSKDDFSTQVEQIISTSQSSPQGS